MEHRGDWEGGGGGTGAGGRAEDDADTSRKGGMRRKTSTPAGREGGEVEDSGSSNSCTEDVAWVDWLLVQPTTGWCRDRAHKVKALAPKNP